MGAGVLPWGQEGAVRAQRRGCGRGLHRSRGPAAPGPEGTKPAPLPSRPHLSLASPTGRAQLSPRGQEAGSHEPPGAEKQGWRRRMAGSGAGRQRSALLQGTLVCPATPGPAGPEDPRPGSEEAGVCGPGGSRPGLSFPQVAAPCPRGMCG